MKMLLAIVGMPGSGKSEATTFFQAHGFSKVRFGDFTDESLQEEGREITPENEQTFREEIRKKEGMDVYAKKAKNQIDTLLKRDENVIIDGLYSWQEFTYLKSEFPDLTLIHIYARPKTRYERLKKRAIRPLTQQEARERDYKEIENLQKGGPIAIADFMVENESNKETLVKNLQALLAQLL